MSYKIFAWFIIFFTNATRHGGFCTLFQVKQIFLSLKPSIKKAFEVR